jgi:hypothetical protein
MMGRRTKKTMRSLTQSPIRAPTATPLTIRTTRLASKAVLTFVVVAMKIRDVITQMFRVSGEVVLLSLIAVMMPVARAGFYHLEHDLEVFTLCRCRVEPFHGCCMFCECGLDQITLRRVSAVKQTVTGMKYPRGDMSGNQWYFSWPNVLECLDAFLDQGFPQYGGVEALTYAQFLDEFFLCDVPVVGHLYLGSISNLK